MNYIEKLWKRHIEEHKEEKGRRYINDPSEAPDDANVQEGQQGGIYYETGGGSDDSSSSGGGGGSGGESVESGEGGAPVSGDTASEVLDIVEDKGNQGLPHAIYQEVHGEGEFLPHDAEGVREEFEDMVESGDITEEHAEEFDTMVNRPEGFGDRTGEDVVRGDRVNSSMPGKKIRRVEEIDEEEGVIRGEDGRQNRDGTQEIDMDNISWVAQPGESDFWEDYSKPGGYHIM